MNARRILIVGGLAAGPSAAAKAVRVNPAAEVTMFESGETISYGLCESPYAISGTIPDETRLVAYTPDRLREEKGVDVKTLHVVESIQPSAKKITVRNLRRRTQEEFRFDRLIIATGSVPRRLGLDGESSRNVFHLRSRDDTVGMMRFIKSESPSKAVIIGGGYVGMEMCESLRTLGMDVTLIHRRHLPMAGLEQRTRERLLEELEANGVHFVTNATAEGFVQDKEGRVRNVVSKRGTFDADIVVLAVGVDPNAALARTAKIRLGAFKGIVTDERQQTSVEGIYAAGDCCEVMNPVTGQNMYIPLATNASRQGRVAGENAAGGRAVFKGTIRAIAVKVFGLEVAQVGVSADEARRAGFEPITESITASTRVALMPGAEKIGLMLIVDRPTHRLLGANVFGGSGSVLRANTLGVAIQQKLTVDDVARFDLIYAPQFSPLWDPILVAAEQARKRL